MIDTRALALADQLLLMERELRRQEMWGDQAPAPDALASQTPFCVDTLALEEWLQWVFVPRLKLLLEAGAPLPARCAISPMGEEAFQGRGARFGALIDILREIDRLLDTP